jgi:hypothetical protein
LSDPPHPRLVEFFFSSITQARPTVRPVDMPTCRFQSWCIREYWGQDREGLKYARWKAILGPRASQEGVKTYKPICG